MSRPAPSALVIGGTPRVDLLPPEVRAKYRSGSMRRGLGALVVVMAIATGGGIALATLLSVASSAALAAEQQTTQDLLAQQLEFVEVTQLKNESVAIEQARVVGGSTEILWPAYLAAVKATMPAGTDPKVIGVQSSSPIATIDQPTVPLQQPRVASIKLSLSAPDFATVAAWIAALPGLTGYADATLTSIEPGEGGVGVLANVTVNITAEAFANRFLPADEAAATTKEDGQ
jgi:hypothetical protein